MTKRTRIEYEDSTDEEKEPIRKKNREQNELEKSIKLLTQQLKILRREHQALYQEKRLLLFENNVLKIKQDNNLKTIKRLEELASSKYNGIETSVCNVCTEDFMCVYALACKHPICLKCLLSWYKQNSIMTCPVCRHEYFNFDEKNVHAQVIKNFKNCMAKFGGALELCITNSPSKEVLFIQV
jgi:hypothetical protein